jgi:hypothetical protein
MRHPAHEKYRQQVSCQVCHAQWAFNDFATSLLRLDDDDLEEGFTALAVQGSSEVERLVVNNMQFEQEEMPLVSTDKITGSKKSGVWLKGYQMRRWEEPIIKKDAQGVLQVMRPLLAMQLSWVNDEGEVIFDAVQPPANKSSLTPYTPHTTGKAGAFWQMRVKKVASPETEL